MVEMRQRTGKIWTGKVQAEITEVRSDGSKAKFSTEHRYAEILFGLDTETGEVDFRPGNLDRSSERMLRGNRDIGLGRWLDSPQNQPPKNCQT
jgi:hypothetical protein